MSPDPDGCPLTRKLRVTDIEDNAQKTIAVTDAERAAMTALLDLVALENLNFDCRLHLGAGGKIHLSGRLEADVTQTCVITLEPVQASLDVPVEVEFWPASLVEDLESKAEDPAQAGLVDWPERIVDGMIDLGPVVYETLATALDPYPKKPGASFQWSEEGGEAEPLKSGPFAALEQLKKR